jgi:hypothetical protein
MKMKPSRQQVIIAATALVALLVVVYIQMPSSTPGQTAVKKARGKSASPDDIPTIDLARLEAKPEASEAGGRDIFLFGPSPARAKEIAAEAAAAQAAEAAARAAAPPAPIPEATPTPFPTMELRYFGSVDVGRGVTAALFETERNEILKGTAGELIANRYKITRIGFESVDVEDVLGGGSRRLPLKAKP